MAASPAATIVSVLVISILTLLIMCLIFLIFDTPYVTVTLLSARGLDADEQTARTTNAVEFDVAIGFLHLDRYSAVAYDGGNVTIFYSGVKVAEGPVPEFYVAGGHGQVEATRTVATDKAAPLSQKFRDYLQVSQQLDGYEFVVHLSLYDAYGIVTGDTKRSQSHYHCAAGLPRQGRLRRLPFAGRPHPFMLVRSH